MKRSLTAGALIAACGAGCGGNGPTDEPTAVTSSPIQSGTTDAMHAFALGMVQTSQLKSHQISVCSGALLAPNLVATARHCVSPLATPVVDCASSTFSGVLPAADLLVTTDAQLTGTSSFVAVSEIIVPAGPGQSKVCGNDIALMILQKGIQLPKYVVPAIDPPMTDHSAYATTVTAIGYGIDTPTDMSGASAGVRRIKQGVGLVCIPSDKSFVDCFKDPQAAQVLTVGEFVSGDASTCDGDSGSGAYDQRSFDRGQWVSFGVLSRGGVSQDGQTCIQPIYTRFDAWKQLLVDGATKASSLGGYPLPAWATTASSSAQNAVGVADGTPCASSDECQSTNCVSTLADAMTGVCASACNAGSCPKGFGCTSGFCLANAMDPVSNPGGGCNVAPSGVSEPGPWGFLWRGSLGFAAVALTRRRRR